MSLTVNQMPSEVVVDIDSLRPGESPRVDADMRHARLLAAAPSELPPIVVHRPTMRVVDGVHRLLAAKLRGDRTIAVELVDGSLEDAFLEGVRRNTRHGKPLTLAEREAAAQRIVVAHSDLSDRAIALVCGLSPGTIGLIRRRSTGSARAIATARIGRDGRRRPTDPEAARLRIVKALEERPDASLRAIAREVGTSPGTVSDVRQRLEEGRSPVPERLGGAVAPSTKASPLTHTTPPTETSRPNASPEVSAATAGGQDLPGVAPADRPRLTRDGPCSRDHAITSTEPGQQFAAWFDAHRVTADESRGLVDRVPISRVYAVVDEARKIAQVWIDFAEALERRTRSKRRSRKTQAEPL